MIADGFKLIHIEALLCSSQIKPAERFQRIVTFETSDKYRVLLMELKHGARGLSVIFPRLALYMFWPVPVVTICADVRTQKHRDGIPGDLLRTGVEG